MSRFVLTQCYKLLAHYQMHNHCQRPINISIILNHHHHHGLFKAMIFN